ncbi:MAG TPA: hypothetical protein VFY49_05735 [Myxococcota bacterium]|nr:hypothetical protein [Myxococcota bacterium]
MASHITRYDLMPIPPIEAHTQWFDAGAVRFGVEYRLLTDAIAAAAEVEAATGTDRADPASFDDRGVSIHVEGRDAQGALEYLRFDCFEEDPHYHYVSWSARSNEMLHIDAIAEGDPLAWALERLRTRLPEMLARAGAAHIAKQLDARRIADVLPQVAEAAYRARRAPDAHAPSAKA